MKNNETINASGVFFTMAPLTRDAHVASLYIISLLCMHLLDSLKQRFHNSISYVQFEEKRLFGYFLTILKRMKGYVSLNEIIS